jgi:hypothetical protein
MNERVKEITYKGKRIVYCDLSDAKAEEAKGIMDEVVRVIMGKGTSDQLLLVNIESFAIDSEVLENLKVGAKRVRPYLKAVAGFGLTGLKYIFMNAINRFSGSNGTAHQSMEEAKEYLISQAYK